MYYSFCSLAIILVNHQNLPRIIKLSSYYDIAMVRRDSRYLRLVVKFPEGKWPNGQRKDRNSGQKYTVGSVF